MNTQADPPVVIQRNQRTDGVWIETVVQIQDFFTMQRLGDKYAAETLSGNPSSRAKAEEIIRKALTDHPELRGYSVIMGYILKDSLEKAMAMRQMGAQQPQPQYAPQQQVGSAPQPQAAQPSGGSWGVGAAPVGAGGGGGGGGGMSATQVPGVRSYSRNSGGGGPSMASPRPSSGGGRGNMQGAQNVRRQAGGIKTWSRPGPSRSPNVAAPSGASDPWAAQKAQTAAILASRGIVSPSAHASAGSVGDSAVVVSSSGGPDGGTE